MLTHEEIRACFEAYHARYIDWQTWDAAIYKWSDKESFLSLLDRRAERLHTIFQENQKAQKDIITPLKQEINDMPRENHLLLYDILQDMYENDWADPFLLKQLATMLMPLFQSAEDEERLIFLHTCMGYACVEISRTFDKKSGALSVEHYRQATAHRCHFDILSHTSRRRILVCYINLFTTDCLMQAISPAEGYAIYQELRDFMKTRLFRDNAGEELTDFVNVYITHFLNSLYSFNSDYLDNHPNGVPDELWQLGCEQLRAEYAKAAERDDPMDCSHDLYLNYHRMLVEEGKMSVMEALTRLEAFFLHRRDNLTDADDVISLYFDFTGMMTMIAMESDLPLIEKRQLSRRFHHYMEAFVTSFNNPRDSYSLNFALQQYTFVPFMLSSFDNRREKLRFIFCMVISRHIVTYLHSLMVARFAILLVGHLVTMQPSLFIGFHGLRDELDVRAHRGELIRFGYDAAILHDIGKNALIDIVNTQYRPIGDDEFAIIRTHPAQGAAYLARDVDFAAYHDVALGHHRFYNGQGGYPADFDNVTSPDRTMIDIITLCDCLDAATDHLGRSYHHAKTVPQVMAEFREGAGTRYNPKLVQLIDSAPELLEEMSVLAAKKRETIYYNACRKFFEHPPAGMPEP